MELDLDRLLDEKDEYSAFVDKFKLKLTTDDCYTPHAIYAAVQGWVFEHYGLADDTKIVRPFWPGANYRATDYPDGCVVIDNPPFSILSEIEQYYLSRNINFFLFAPALTCFKPYKGLKYVLIDESVVYENGAEVATAFVTNMGDWLIETAPDLHSAVECANKAQKSKKTMPKYVLPSAVATAARVRMLARNGVALRIAEKDAMFIRSLESMRAAGKSLFGGGFLLSEKAAAEKAAAEKAAKKEAIVWQLSEKEAALKKGLGAERDTR